MHHLKLLLKVIFVMNLINKYAALKVEDCGITKNCISNPSECSQTDASCQIFTYVYNRQDDNFVMEIRGGTGANSYAAAAFGSTANMQNADLYFCDGTNIRSGTINQRYDPPVIDATLPNGVELVSAGIVEGVAECTFRRPGTVNKTVSNNPTSFDLGSTQFFLLQAIGRLSLGPQPQLSRHAASDRHATGPHNFAAELGMAPPTGEDMTGCGETRGCFRDPRDCLPGTSSCRFVSWVYNSSAQSFNFEFIGGSASGYLAVAFGTMPAMEDADMYYCTQNQFFSGVIRERQAAPVIDSNLPNGLENTQMEASDGVLRCSFTRPASVVKTALNGPTDFNLANTEYYLLYASGGLSNGGLSYHGRTSRVISGQTINFRETGAVGGADKLKLVKAHASLMLIAWLTCASIGVIIARHFKPLWHNQTLFDTKVWFQLHRGLMITVLLCTVTAFVIIFIAVNGYSASAGAHPILGIIVTALVLINPTMALFRPHPGTAHRPIFNWAHFLVGTVARILGVVTIFFGVEVIGLPRWNIYVLAGFVGFHVLIEILLEILSAVYGHIDIYKKRTSDDKIDMGGDAQPPSVSKPKGVGLKYSVLVVYVLGNLAFLITIIVSVAGL